MFEKIGLHIISGHNRPLGKAPCLTVVNIDVAYYRQLRQEVGDDCVIAVRWTDWDNYREPAMPIAAHLNDMRQMAHPKTVFIGRNEPVVREDNVRDFKEYERARAHMLHEAGLNVAWFSPSVGEFGEMVWVYLSSLLNEMGPNDVVAVHEYWTDAADVHNPWHVARWQKIPCLKGVPILVTEFGRDRIEDTGLPPKRWGASGWKRGGISLEQYLNEIASANDILMGYPNVLGAALFTVGNDSRWRDYDAADPYDYIRDHRTPWKPPVKPAPSPALLPIPGARISQRFGENPEYYRSWGLLGHNGVDFAAPKGVSPREFHNTVVQSVSRGRAVIGVSKGYGLYVYVYDETCDWLYAHLSEVLIESGSWVEPGQAVGIVGYTGNTQPVGIKGTHLHWGKRPKPYRFDNGYRGYVDPLV